MTSDNKAKGRYDKRDFVYVEAADEYRCPAGRQLPYRHSSVEDGMRIKSYYTTACPTCELKAQCTTGKERRVRRWEHESVLDAMQHRLNITPGEMNSDAVPSNMSSER